MTQNVTKGSNFINRVLRPTLQKRVLFFLLSDAALICFSLFVAFLIHFDFSTDISYVSVILEVLPYFIITKLLALGIFRVYRATWRYVGINDLANILLAVMFAELTLLALSVPNSVLPPIGLTGFPKRVLFVDGALTLCLIGGLRISKRLFLEVIRERRPLKKGTATVIIGAGDTGEMILRDMIRNHYERFYPVGFLDDARQKRGAYIHGVKVLGTLDDLATTMARYSVEALVVAIPTLNHQRLKKIYESAKKLKISTIKIVPRMYDFTKPDINLKSLEDISIEDLIGRQSIQVNYEKIREFIAGQSVLVTGAGGSIGSEIVAQVCLFAPARLILLDIDETELHDLDLRLRRLHPQLTGTIVPVVGDVRDQARVTEVFEEFKPEIVFHAAAYKHVPLMESNAKEAVKVNVFGTYTLVRACLAQGVERFIMISTDKAVRPTSVMGATKRIAEYICRAYNDNAEGRAQGETERDQGPERPEEREKSGKKSTRFISVRFGNVFGSRGSVLPIFLNQLKHGGPLTVTHREMKRYFMTIPEAVSLVLQASTMGTGGEVFVLDMGEPVKIVELAEELIRIHGLEPYDDIDIAFTGLRPGEKLFEEILTAEEGTEASRHEKVFVARNGGKHSKEEIALILEDFEDALKLPPHLSLEEVRSILRKYVVHYS